MLVTPGFTVIVSGWNALVSVLPFVCDIIHAKFLASAIESFTSLSLARCAAVCACVLIEIVTAHIASANKFLFIIGDKYI